MFRLVMVLGVLWAGWAAAQDGLFATLQTTQGDIRMRLHYDLVPRTVANFLTLAEGTRPWVDSARGRPVTNRFYNGIIFHRVITNFMIQAGSPNKQGTDGPGYRFSDEFHPSLTHSNAGVVSMANSGTNSNGSQFFITTVAATHLNNKHAVFGHVVSGQSVVDAISGAPTNPTNNRPWVDIVITNVVIERIGTAAQAFNPLAVTPALPAVKGCGQQFGLQGGAWVLQWTPRTNCLYQMYGNVDLRNDSAWVSLYSGTDTVLYVDGVVQSVPRATFATLEIEYFETF